MKSPSRIRYLLRSVMVGCWPDLASKDAVADDGVEQHQREDDDTRSPEHEGETGMRRRGFFDRYRERDRQRPERRRENEQDHVKRRSIPATPNALGRHQRRDGRDRREDK